MRDRDREEANIETERGTEKESEQETKGLGERTGNAAWPMFLFSDSKI